MIEISFGIYSLMLLVTYQKKGSDSHNCNQYNTDIVKPIYSLLKLITHACQSTDEPSLLYCNKQTFQHSGWINTSVITEGERDSVSEKDLWKAIDSLGRFDGRWGLQARINRLMWPMMRPLSCGGTWVECVPAGAPLKLLTIVRGYWSMTPPSCC